MRFEKKLNLKRILSTATLLLSVAVYAEIQKVESTIVTETTQRGRAKISRQIQTRFNDSTVLNQTDYAKSKKIVADKKTVDLIKQIESLLKRPGQKGREGELKMRLAELYFDFSQSLALKEGETWELALKKWESLSESEKKKYSRPTLKTPKADALRAKTLTLYKDLEKRSRNKQEALANGIRRDDVLYFLGSTLLDLGKRAEAIPFYKELTSEFPKNSRAFASHMNLADLLFERKLYSEAIPHYLAIAAEKNIDKELENIQAYAVYKLAWCYSNTREFDKSVTAFRKALQLVDQPLGGRKIVLDAEILSDLSTAFVNAEQYKEGESFFVDQGARAKESLYAFWRQASLSKEDKAQFTESIEYLDKLIAAKPMSLQAKDWVLDKLSLYAKAKNSELYLKTLKSFSENYGVGSSWWRERTVTEQKLVTEELVGTLRREAKNRHKIAQSKNENALYSEAEEFYKIYFEYVPEPNPETLENLSEMRFYYGELLYRLGKYIDAEKQYALVTDKKLFNTASYNRVLSLQKTGLTQKDSDVSLKFQKAVDAFVTANPKDTRAGQLLYLAANQAFESGKIEDSLARLELLTQKYSNDKIGIEAAERVLFILEQKGDLAQVAARARQFSQNKELSQTGGEKFKSKLSNMALIAEFKNLTQLPETSPGELVLKSQEFLKFSLKVKDDLKEKSLQNARVFAEKSGDTIALKTAEAALIKEFPKSEYAGNIYLKRAQEWAALANWKQAAVHYQTYYNLFGQKTDEKSESALWNTIFIETYLQDLTAVTPSSKKQATSELASLGRKYLNQFPKGKNRTDVLEMVMFYDSKTTFNDVKKFSELPQLTSLEKALIQDAEWLLKNRSGELSKSSLAQVKSSDLKGPIAREVVSRQLFQSIQSEYEGYQKTKISFSPNAFAQSIKSKLDRLEALEKKYLNVVSFGRASTAFPSLERISRAYIGLAEEIQKAPVDKEGLKTFTDPLFEKGRSFVKRCVEKALEIKSSSSEVLICRTRAKLLGIGDQHLESEKIPKPLFVPSPQSIQFTNVIMNNALASASKQKWGEMKLALRVLLPIESSFSKEEKAFYNILTGIDAYQSENNEKALKHFRMGIDSSPETGIPQIARKNLTALYLEIGDTASAFDTISQSDPQDPVGALLFGISAKGEGELDSAIKAYDYGLSLAPNDTSLLYNLALAMAASNVWNGAVSNIQKYIELVSPSQSDESRQMLKTWRAKSGQTKDLPEVSL